MKNIFKFILISAIIGLISSKTEKFLSEFETKNPSIAPASFLQLIEEKINQFTRELKTAMFLVGASNIEELKQKRLIITGKTREILTELNIDTKKYARRI